MQLANVPYWVSIPLALGGTLVTTFSGQLPEQVQFFGLLLGIVLTAIGVIGWAFHFFKWQKAGVTTTTLVEGLSRPAAQQQSNRWWLTLLLLPLLALVWATERWLSHPEHPATIVDFNKFAFLPPHEDVEGSPIKLNYYFRNKGPKHAFNVKKGARLLIQSGPFSAKEEAIERIFSDSVSRAKQRHDGEGRAMAVDEEGLDTVRTKPLDAIDVASLKAGKSRLYFIGIITHSDQHGDWQSRRCLWYGPGNPEPPHRIGHFCMSNNNVKRPSDWEK